MGRMAYPCTWRSARWRREGDGGLPAAAVTDIGTFRAALDGARSTDANGSRCAYYLKRGPPLGGTCCVLRAVV